MNAHAPVPSDAAPGDSADARAERQLAMLDRLAEAGMEVVVAVERRAKEAGPEEDLNALAMAYARAARAVRLTIMLQSKLARDIEAGGEASARRAALAQAQAEAERGDPEYLHKARVERIVERVAKAEHGDDEDEVDRLVIEAGERLDDEDLCRDLLSRPVGELVALICRDLGLDPDWTAMAQEPWARDEAAAGDPRSPFAARAPRPPPTRGSDLPLRPSTGPP